MALQASDEAPRDAGPDVIQPQISRPWQRSWLQQDDWWVTPCMLETPKHAGDASQAIDVRATSRLTTTDHRLPIYILLTQYGLQFVVESIKCIEPYVLFVLWI
jgi:hypothetical protein